jgi:hypothetical protein
VTCFGADVRGSISGRGRLPSILHRVQTVTGSHLVSYPVGTEGFIPEDKRVGA